MSKTDESLDIDSDIILARPKSDGLENLCKITHYNKEGSYYFDERVMKANTNNQKQAKSRTQYLFHFRL